ncbi:MAG TPA: hypothetical protein PKK15_06470 [Kouleothrix sp.]|uniref:hypothetical protein n=1 Tax=Kouleothrix sp. TaxID=2779161 RepID=UPI002C25DCB0|nr:hypothetical protein [Kouleothrix sp.]
MKRFLVALSLVMAMCFSILPGAAFAAPAYQTPFSVSITYQNVGTGTATINVSFFAENSGTAQTFSAGTLAAGASTSLSVGQAVQGGSFKGSAVLSSDQPVIATIVQVDASGAVKNRPLSNGFSASDGNAKQLVASVLKNAFNSTTVFSVQNTESAPVNVTVKYFAVGASSPSATATANNLPAGAAKYFDAGAIGDLPNGFSGSAVATAVLASDNTTPAKIVVTANELSTVDGASKSFEGTALSGPKVYMPSALCNAFGGQTTAYAVQNAGNSSVTFNVRYKLSGAADVIDGPYTIGAGGKQSIGGCTKLSAGGNGSAIIESTTPDGQLVAVGKVTGANITSAFLGVVENNGSAKVALPYVRYASNAEINKQQRTSIAIQNIGSADATNVKVQFIDKDGNVKGTHTIGTIAAGGKASSNPTQGNALDACGRFGMYGANGSTTDCNSVLFGGGAIVTADSGAQLAVVVRIFTGSPIAAGEDYNGINVQ